MVRLSTAAEPSTTAADPNLPAITSIQQLRLLSREEARRGYPAKVTAVVTYFDLAWNTLFVEDDEAGCFVFLSDKQRRLDPGQQVEIEGRSDTGFVPVIRESRLAVLGTAPMPEPRVVTLDQLISGSDDSQRVRVRSVVRSMLAEYGRLMIDFGETGGRFQAHVPNFRETNLPLHLIDARVEMTGVVGSNLSPQEQQLGIRLYLPSLDDIRVLDAAPTNAFDRPAQTVDSLLWFNPAAAVGQRIKISGVVTLASTSGKFFIKDATGATAVKLLPPQARLDRNGLYLDARPAGPLKPGDQVDVVGYPTLGDYAPILNDALVRKTGSGPDPKPVEVTAERALSGRYDGNLVTLQARLIGQESRRMGNAVDQILTLQTGDTIFDARLEGGAALSIAQNSLLQITGICVIQPDERRNPRAFRVLLRQAGDVAVLEAPPRWTLQHSLGVLAVTMGVAILALVWAWNLRQRVQSQEQSIGSLKREADLRERYRMLFESLQDVYYQADLDGITRIVSPSCGRVLGYGPAELIGQPTALPCVNPGEREKLFQALMQEGSVNDYEMPLRRKDGRQITVSLNAHVVRDAKGRIIATEGFLRDITLRKQAEEDLRESQQLLSSITHNISDAIYRSTPEKGLVYVNDSFVKMFGYDSDVEVLKLSSGSLYADPRRRAELIRLIERDRRFLSQEVEFVRKDGSHFWGLTSSIGIYDARTGQAIYFDGAIVDITGRKRIEQERQQLNEVLEGRIAERTAALRQSDERFTKAFQASPAILSILRLPSGQYVDVNNSFLQTFGFARDEVIGRTSLELNMWQDPKERAQLFESLGAGKAIHNKETRYQTKTGEPRLILISVELIEIGNETCLLSVGQDITENKRVQAALAESEAHTRLIIDTALDAVITMDAAGIISGWNPQAEAIFGWSREEVMGRLLADTIIPGQHRDAHERGLRHFLATGEGPVLNRRIELTALHRGGQEFPAELAVTALRVGGSYIFSAFVRDITERKRAEEELLRALEREKELGKLKSNFVSMVSHEFRTPLGIIMSSAEILERYLERLQPEQRRDHLQAIHKAVQRMAGMMEEVLVLGRVEAGKMECKPAPMDLAAFCTRLTDELLSVTNRQCPIEFECHPLPGEAQADENLLRHIFTNLLANAVKYSKPDSPVHFMLRYKDGQAVFTVQDLGVGIPEPDQQWIFKAFHRGQNVGNIPGTGLGLTIVKRCVELHGGKIKCQSEEGAGTTFTVTLPLFGRPVLVGSETAFFMNRP